MIARPQRSPSRLFPLLTAYGYTKSFELDSGTPDQQAAASLLSLAKLHLTRSQQFFSYKLSPQAHLARLLMQHQLGLEAEQKAQWQRADFYWQQVQNQLKALSKREAVWQALADEITQKCPDAEFLSQPLILRQRLVEELLIDTHCGFYNSLTEPGEASAWGDRPFTHIRHLEKLLPYSSLTPQEVQFLLADAWQQQINQYRAAKNWSEAIKLCRHRLTYCPDSIPYQNELAEMQASAISAKLTNGKSEKQQLQDAKQLKKGIQQFETLAKTYPHNIALLDYLGNLHHLHAICLGNSGLVAEGLVAVEKALIYTPYLRDATLTRKHLTQAMEGLSEYAKQAKAQLARNPNIRLNSEGRRVLTQSQKGFALREWYLNSKYATNARKSVQVAEAMGVWRNIQGLPDPTDEQQAIALLNGLNTILKHSPISQEALPTAWQTVVKAHPELSTLDTEGIYAFLKQRIWKIEQPVPIVTPTQTEQPPILKPFHATPQPSREPFLAWVCSRQNLGLKAQTAIATIALLIVGNLSLYELSVRAERKTAYDQILALDPQQDPTEMIAAAEQFLNRRPLSGKDAREVRVKELYTQAFVSWFLQQPDALNEATTQEQFERYQTLTQAE